MMECRVAFILSILLVFAKCAFLEPPAQSEKANNKASNELAVRVVRFLIDYPNAGTLKKLIMKFFRL